MKHLYKNRIVRPVLRVLAVIFTASLLTIFTGGTVEAAGGECGDGVKWSLSGGILTISGNGAMTDFSENRMAPWYENREKIISVSFSGSVTNVGNLAFYGCTSLQSASITEGITHIGDLAFAGCKQLSRVSLPSGLISIGDNAFSGCESLNAVRLPESLLHIGYQAFYRCTGLTSIRIPASVSNFGSSAFAYCTNLMQAVVDSKISTLPRWTFYGCTSLVNVSLPSTMQKVGEYAFFDCDKLGNAYHSGTPSDREQISGQIQNNVPGFTGVIEGDSSDIGSSSVSSSTQHGGGTVVETDKGVIDTENVIIDITVNQTKPETGKNEYDVIIDAVVENEDGWKELIDNIGGYLKYPERYEGDKQTTVKDVKINVDLKDSTRLPSNILQSVAGKDVQLTVSAGNNASWSLRGTALDKDTASESYNLGFSLISNEKPSKEQKELIEECKSYILEFKDVLPFEITVHVPLGGEYAGHIASLYEKPILKSWRILQSVYVDEQGMASFYLASYDKQTEYMIAIDVPGVLVNDILIPEEKNDDYGTLMDIEGNRYKLSGIESSWGISFLQMNLILAGIIVLCVLTVGIAAWAYNKNKQLKKKWENMKK